MKRTLIPLLIALPFFCNAQVYKCNVNGVETFSDLPCGDDAEAISITKGKAKGVSESSLINQCLELVKRSENWKDPDSLKVVNHYKRWEQDDSGARQLLVLAVKAKNSYGAYDKTSYPRCFLNHNGTGLSKIQYFINRSR